jgi:uncharacterized membrane protein
MVVSVLALVPTLLLARIERSSRTARGAVSERAAGESVRELDRAAATGAEALPEAA